MRFTMSVIAVALAVLIASLGAAPSSSAQSGAAPTDEPGKLEVIRLRPNFYMIAGTGGNIAVQTGVDGVVLVDTGLGSEVDAVAAAIRRITDRPIRYIVNTSADPDHVGGNEFFHGSGQASFDTIRHLFPRNYILTGLAGILASEGVLRRMSAPSGQVSPYPVIAWPTETFDTGRRYMYFNAEGIEVLHRPSAHTDGDSTVFFRRSDVIVAGDILDMDRFPIIDLERGGSLQGTIQALNQMIATAIPSVPDVSREGGTSIIPGHGQVADQFDLLNYRDMLVIVRDHVQDLIEQGKTLEQIKAADPSPAKGFIGRYGSATGRSTTNDFIEVVYRSLIAGR